MVVAQGTWLVKHYLPNSDPTSLGKVMAAIKVGDFDDELVDT